MSLTAAPARPGGDRLWRWSALPLSLLGHGAAVGLFLVVSTLTAHRRPARPVSHPVSIRTIGAHEWALNRNPSRSQTMPGPTAPARPVPIPKGQIVDVAPGNNRESATAKYLAETSNTVKKETRAREQTPVYSRATPKNQPAPQQTMKVAKGSTGGRAAPPVPAVGALDLLASANGFRPRLSQLMHEASVAKEETNVDALDKAGEADSQRQAQSGDAAESGGGAPNDDLSNVDPGEGTFLNTREWKYASFFNRVKQAVSARWDPMGRLKAHDARAAQLGSTDRVTVVNVALRPDGSIREIFVSQSSGLDYLDQESIQAFEKAQPFANPPAGLVVDGVIRFAFGFKLVNEGPGGPRLFRFGG